MTGECQWQQFGIINHMGEPWTPKTFDTEHAAAEYLAAQRSAWPVKDGFGLRRHRVVPVQVTVAVIKPMTDAEMNVAMVNDGI